MTPACAFSAVCTVGRTPLHVQMVQGWWCHHPWTIQGSLDHPGLPGRLIYRLYSRTLTNCTTDRQAALWVSADTPDILASHLPPPYTHTLHSKVLESIILYNHVLSVTGMALELGHTFTMWLFKVAAPVSGALSSRHKPGLQLLWVDMVSAINWNVRHF